MNLKNESKMNPKNECKMNSRKVETIDLSDKKIYELKQDLKQAQYEMADHYFNCSRCQKYYNNINISKCSKYRKLQDDVEMMKHIIKVAEFGPDNNLPF